MEDIALQKVGWKQLWYMFNPPQSTSDLSASLSFAIVNGAETRETQIVQSLKVTSVVSIMLLITLLYKTRYPNAVYGRAAVLIKRLKKMCKKFSATLDLIKKFEEKFLNVFNKLCVFFFFFMLFTAQRKLWLNTCNIYSIQMLNVYFLYMSTYITNTGENKIVNRLEGRTSACHASSNMADTRVYSRMRLQKIDT